MFKGSMVALVTPFRNNKVDEKCLKSLIEMQIKAGTGGIVPCGTTGESATLSTAEHERVIEVTIKAVNKRVPVIAGTGSNSTEEAIQLTKHAVAAGADASLQIAPYYNRPTQKGLYEHFKAVADAVDIPIILYNIAARTGVNIEPETIAKLAKDCKTIVGVKEASANLEQMSRIRLLCGADFDIISGDDALTLPVMAIGGTGVISVVANIVPKDVAAMVADFQKGKLEKAQKTHYKLLPLVKAMFIETNPIPVKWAVAKLGWIPEGIRLPLTPLSGAAQERVLGAMKQAGLNV